MKTTALVPVKDLRSAKSRLGAAVDAEVRRRLVLDLLFRVLGALQAAPSVGDIRVVTPDPDVLQAVQARGVPTFEHDGALNVALEAARQAVAAERLLVALADLPYLQAADVEALHERLGGCHGVAILPDVALQGTNLMLLNPANAVPFCYGPGSALKHDAAARARGLVVVWQPGGAAAVDVDTPADLALLQCS